MSPLDAADNKVTDTQRVSSAYMPPLQRTEGQPPGSVSRWSFHTACIDPTVPINAPCRKNVVVRSFVFF